MRRANEAVEEFGVYVGNGDSNNNLTQLQKICLLCGIRERNDLPQTEEDSVEVRF
jgi:hypothetical protein